MKYVKYGRIEPETFFWLVDLAKRAGLKTDGLMYEELIYLPRIFFWLVDLVGERFAYAFMDKIHDGMM